MGRKIIFCDIENVLTNPEEVSKIGNIEVFDKDIYTAVREPGPCLGRRHLLMLNHAAKKTDSSVIIHSPWRAVYPVTNIECWLRSYNFESSFGGVTVGQGRWMSIFRAINLIKPKKVVILDGSNPELLEVGDSADARDALKEYTIRVDHGLSIKNMHDAILALED